MEKLNKVKNNIKTHIPQTIGVVAVLAVSIVIMILCIGGCDSGDKEAVSTEKSASEGITTDKLTLEQKTTADEKDTTEESAETTTDSETGDETTDDETTDKEVTTGNQQVMQNTTTAGQTTIGSHQVVQNTTTVKQTSSTGQTTTQRQTTAQRQTTTKKQEMTTPQQTTTAAPRGKNGVILEELSFVRWNEVISMPKTKTDLTKQTGNSEYCYVIVYNHPAVTQKNIFNNEIIFSQTTESEVISMYGTALTSYTTENGKFLVYQYGYYANGNNEEKIYIRFGFAKVLDMRLGSVGIGNAHDLGLENYFN